MPTREELDAMSTSIFGFAYQNGSREAKERVMALAVAAKQATALVDIATILDSQKV